MTGTTTASAKTESQASFFRNDLGLDEPFFGLHMSQEELDAELLLRFDAKVLKDLSTLNETTWFGYRFAHPATRLYLFIHYYRKAFVRTAKMIGRRHLRPAFLDENPLHECPKQQVTGFVTAMATADIHGIPYEFYIDEIMERIMRNDITAPPFPHQMYQNWLVEHVCDRWRDRNEYGIYLAKAPQFELTHYVGHSWQIDYQTWLMDKVYGKGNRAFWLARLMYDIKHLTEALATERFGPETVENARYLHASI